VKTEEVVARGLLIVFEHTVDAVLQRQPALQGASGIERRHHGGPAQARAHYAGFRRQQAAETFEPFVLVVRARTRAGAEAQREPLARLQRRAQFRREHGAQGARLFGLDQRAAADEQVSGPIDDACHLHLYTSKSWAKRASSSS
jgi:hypothetical protein